MDLTELGTLLNEQGDAIAQFRKNIDNRLDSEKKEREGLEARLNRLALGGARGGENDDHELKEIGEAFRTYIKSGDQAGIQETIQTKGMSVGSDPEGGYAVYPTLSSSITTRVFESSPLRRFARVVTIGSDSFEELVDINEPDAGWVGEKQARTDTNTPDLGKLRIPVREIYAMPKVTQKLLDDSSIDIGAWLVDKCGKKFTRMETSAFFNGDGVLRPRGFLTYPTASTDDDTRAWGTIQHVVTADASGFKAATATVSPADCLIDLQSELKGEYRDKAVWMMNKRTAGMVRKFKDVEGAYVWQNAIAVGQPPMLLGHAVVLAEDMPDVEAGTYPIAFGDFGEGYTIVDRRGDRLLRDPYTDKPNVRFYMYRRVGGDVNNFEAIKLLKVAAS